MILIADSGASKTDWRIIDQHGTIEQAKTAGINPYYMDSQRIGEEIKTALKPLIPQPVKQIHFYGAGCSSQANCNVVASALQSVFPEAEVSINHDLLGAARALCLHDPGIVCILGTGANSCLYDGGNIAENIPSVGYILGDEGSGSHFGKLLMADFIRDKIPSKIKDSLVKHFNLNRELILKSVYQDKTPIKFLAGFSKFIFRNIKDPYLYDLVYHSFDNFIENNIMRYTDYQHYDVHFSGGIAFYFNSLLRKVAADKNITVKKILESPIAGLTVYHNEGLNK